MTGRSLRLRLFAGAVVLIIVAMAAAGLAIAMIFNNNTESAQRAELTSGLNRLIAQIDAFAPQPLPEAPLGESRYATPFSGAYWQVEDRDTGATWRSRSLWDVVLVTGSETAGTGEHRAGLTGPDGQALTALMREVRFAVGADNLRRFLVTVAQDRASLDRTSDQFRIELALTLLVLGLGLVAAAWLLLHLGLRPLRELQRGLLAVQRGDAPQLPDRFPVEMQPLVREMNGLLDVRTRSLAKVQGRAAQLAEQLTPLLSNLRALAARLRRSGDSEGATTLETAIAGIEAHVGHQTRLAGLRLRMRQRQMQASLNEAVDRSIAELRRAGLDGTLDWRLHLPPGLLLDIDRSDLAELLSAVLRELAACARSYVEVTATITGDLAQVQLEADGVLAPAQDGLDRALANEIVSLNGGTLEAGQAAEGRAVFTLALPIAATIALPAPPAKGRLSAH